MESSNNGTRDFEHTGTQLYSQFIHRSRYSKWIESQQKRESWPETVERYLTFFANKNEDKRIKNLVWETRDSILNCDVMPSMRCLMTAGEALERDNVAGYNPIAGYERVVTKEFGNVPIKELANKSATVLNKDGVWTYASFRSYGVQPLHRVTFRLNSNTIKTVDCTSNHRWILQNGDVVSTENLREYDRVDFVSSEKSKEDSDYILGIRHGIVYGDGTATKSCGRVKGYHVRLCGESKELLWAFEGYPVSYAPSANGDPIVMMYDSFAATHSLKSLPSSDETPSYLLGFIRGWIAADGSVSKSSQISLCVKEEGLDWLQSNAEKNGFVIQRVYKVQSSETNYGVRKNPSFVVNFSRSSCGKEDFLCSWKKENFKSLQSHFVVKSIESLGVSEEVFCAEVPETNTFVLEGGLVTGNCSYLVVDHPRAFDEMMYILMCGTGVGFSVERQYVNKLPEVAETFEPTSTVIVVGDSKIGWAKAFKELVSLLYAGQVPTWDLSKVRPSGAKLKTFGGRASGPGPLDDLFHFTVAMFKRAAGRRLTSIEAHDLCCKIADIVVVGGVRRSALISLSNPSDDRMRVAKNGQWWESNPQRALANNSAAYTEKPDFETFLKEWSSLYESKSGERGIFSRTASKKQAEKTGRRDPNHEFGTNPCSEIILRPNQFCNLSEVIARHDDDYETLSRKVRVATILGTIQSTLTDFRYLRSIWKKNTEEERLLGVSITGIMDHPILGNPDHPELPQLLQRLKEVAIYTNKELADILGIEQSVSITCVKPSGCTSLDTVIRTNKGSKSMLELFEENNIDLTQVGDNTWHEPTQDIFVFDENGEQQLITKYFVNGYSPMVEIETEDGQTYKFTPTHKIKTTKGWKQASQLTIDDEIVSFDEVNQLSRHLIQELLTSTSNQEEVNNEKEKQEEVA